MTEFDISYHGAQIFTADNNPVSWGIKNAQGDFKYSHVCSLWLLDGEWWILTTGARWSWKKLAFVFGRVKASEYLAKREWVARRRVDLTPEMQEIRLQTLLRLESRETPYALAKLMKLCTWRFKAGVADKLHTPPEIYPVKTFCAESEALSIIEAKREIYMQLGAAFQHAQKIALEEVNTNYPEKLEACVHTPESLFDSPDSKPG